MEKNNISKYSCLELWIGLWVGLIAPFAIFGRAAIIVPATFMAIGAIVILFLNKFNTSYISFLIKRKIFAFGSGIFVISIILSINSIHPMISITTISRTYFLALLGAVIFRFLQHSPRAHLGAEIGLQIGVGLAALYCLATYFVFAQVVWPLSKEGENLLRIGLAFKAYASVIPMTVVVLVCLAWNRRGDWRGWLCLAIAMVSLVALYGDGAEISRSAMAGLLAAAIVPLLGALLFAIDRRLAACVLVLLLVAGIATALLVFETLRNAVHVTPFHPPLPIWLLDAHRQAIWGFAWGKVLEAPILGWGVNTINMVPGAKMLVPGLVPKGEFIPSHPHNFLLEFMGELGLPLGAALVGFVIVMISSIGPSRSQRDASRWGALALAATFWTSSSSNFSIWSFWWLVCMVVLLSIVSVRFDPHRH